MVWFSEILLKGFGRNQEQKGFACRHLKGQRLWFSRENMWITGEKEVVLWSNICRSAFVLAGKNPKLDLIQGIALFGTLGILLFAVSFDQHLATDIPNLVAFLEIFEMRGKILNLSCLGKFRPAFLCSVWLKNTQQNEANLLVPLSKKLCNKSAQTSLRPSFDSQENSQKILRYEDSSYMVRKRKVRRTISIVR